MSTGAPAATVVTVAGAGRITGLEPDPRRPGVIRVYADGRLTWTVSRGVAQAEALHEGQKLEEALQARLEIAADDQAAWRTVLRHLERRSWARGDLERRLRQKGHPPESARRAVERAREAGLIDDAKFAAEFIELKAARGRGPARLLRDLQAMAVEDVVARRAVSLWSDQQADPDAMPRELARKRSAQLRNVARPARRRRVLNYLARRGFQGNRIRALVEEEMEASSQ